MSKSARRIRIHGSISGVVRLDPEAAHKVRDVLRLETGEHIELIDDDGASHDAELVTVSAESVEASILATSAAVFTPVPVTIGVPLLKGERMDWAIEKCAESGVATIQVYRADRSIPKDCGAEKLARWKRIAEAAALQSKTGRGPALPEIRPNLEGAIDGHDVIVHLDTGGAAWPTVAAATRPSIILVGPEGGWSDRERDILIQRKSRAVSLGGSIYRAESAVLLAGFITSF